MQGRDLDGVRCAGLAELRTAILGALPANVVLRLNEDCPPVLDVHAWWRINGPNGHDVVNSLSFHLSAAMLSCYLRLPAAARADRCSRLGAWVAWALDSGPRLSEWEEGFDISAVVPLRVFWPDGALAT